MIRAWILMMGFTLGLSAGDVSGTVLDAQTGAPIPRAHVTIRTVLNGDQAIDLAVLTDASGAFLANNLPAGRWQITCDKPGYLSSFVAIVGDAESTPVLRLTQQAVIAGSVVDESGAGVPFVSVALYHRVVVNGRRQMNSASGAHTDDRGEFRIFGLAAGRYYAGVSAQRPPRGSPKLVYAPILYPNATDIGAAQAIDLQPGMEEHLKIRLHAVPGRTVRGRLMPGGQYPSATLSPLDRERFPVALSTGSFWDEKTNAFTIRAVPPGAYRLEATTQMGAQQRRAVTNIIVGDKDIEGIELAPGSLPEVTGRITIDGELPSRAAYTQIVLRSQNDNFGAEMQKDGSFSIRDAAPGSYRVNVVRSDAYARSIQQGGRDVLRDGIVLGESPNGPLEIDLSSHGGTIEGGVALPPSDNPVPVIVGLFRRDGEDLVFDRLAYVNPDASGLGRFGIQGIAPGEYVLFTWRSGSRIAYADAASMREHKGSGKTVRITEDARVSVALDTLLTANE